MPSETPSTNGVSGGYDTYPIQMQCVAQKLQLIAVKAVVAIGQQGARQTTAAMPYTGHGGPHPIFSVDSTHAPH